MPHLLLSPSQPLFGLATQCHLFPVGERTRCATTPNNGCERDYPYYRSSSIVSCLKNIILRNLIRKANWNSVVSPIDPNKRYIAISNKWRYIEKEKRIIFRRGLLDWLLPIWTLPSAWNMWRNTDCLRDWIKSKVAKNQFYSQKKSKRWRIACIIKYQ